MQSEGGATDRALAQGRGWREGGKGGRGGNFSWGGGYVGSPTFYELALEYRNFD